MFCIVWILERLEFEVKVGIKKLSICELDKFSSNIKIASSEKIYLSINKPHRQKRNLKNQKLVEHSSFSNLKK
ncbi:hypothetical protein BpHYR1_051262 [Brachionus plicatilis]|uniref:Uncharacterized protein n=1 Tax=Brachionus plicatilis TaxID=10195 RepID=A0A3M7Q054_BRAPC|nr:hypothetical protein BpHYR1_051262 [Brachionus plicatilis]